MKLKQFLAGVLAGALAIAAVPFAASAAPGDVLWESGDITIGSEYDWIDSLTVTLGIGLESKYVLETDGTITIAQSAIFTAINSALGGGVDVGTNANLNSIRVRIGTAVAALNSGSYNWYGSASSARSAVVAADGTITAEAVVGVGSIGTKVITVELKLNDTATSKALAADGRLDGGKLKNINATNVDFTGGPIYLPIPGSTTGAKIYLADGATAGRHVEDPTIHEGDGEPLKLSDTIIEVAATSKHVIQGGQGNLQTGMFTLAQMKTIKQYVQQGATVRLKFTLEDKLKNISVSDSFSVGSSNPLISGADTGSGPWTVRVYTTRHNGKDGWTKSATFGNGDLTEVVIDADYAILFEDNAFDWNAVYIGLRGTNTPTKERAFKVNVQLIEPEAQGTFTLTDALTALKLANKFTATDETNARLDINKNGTIEVSDALAILKSALPK